MWRHLRPQEGPAGEPGQVQVKGLQVTRPEQGGRSFPAPRLFLRTERPQKAPAPISKPCAGLPATDLGLRLAPLPVLQERKGVMAGRIQTASRVESWQGGQHGTSPPPGNESGEERKGKSRKATVEMGSGWTGSRTAPKWHQGRRNGGSWPPPAGVGSGAGAGLGITPALLPHAGSGRPRHGPHSAGDRSTPGEGKIGARVPQEQLEDAPLLFLKEGQTTCLSGAPPPPRSCTQVIIPSLSPWLQSTFRNDTQPLCGRREREGMSLWGEEDHRVSCPPPKLDILWAHCPLSFPGRAPPSAPFKGCKSGRNPTGDALSSPPSITLEAGGAERGRAHHLCAPEAIVKRWCARPPAPALCS